MWKRGRSRSRMGAGNIKELCARGPALEKRTKRTAPACLERESPRTASTLVGGMKKGGRKEIQFPWGRKREEERKKGASRRRTGKNGKERAPLKGEEDKNSLKKGKSAPILGGQEGIS